MNVRPAQTTETTPNHITDGQPSDQQGITHFSADTATVSATLPVRKSNYRRFTSIQSIDADNTIKEFVGRAMIIKQGQFSTTDAIASPLYGVQWSTLITTAQWYDKYKGHYGIRFDLKLRLQINAPRTVQGRYMLVFVPTAGTQTLTGSSGEMKLTSNMFSLWQRSQLPHAEIDVACETETVLDIPYQMNIPFTPIHAANGQFNAGNIYIYPYSPLDAVTAPLTVDYTLYASMHNVQFQGASVPQMGTIAEEEQKSAGLGPISTALTNISNAATIASEIPILSSFAGEAAWATAIGARIASAFGWSKPQIVSPHTRVLRNTFQGFANCDVADASQPISTSAANNVVVQPGALGTDVDEMSISHIAQKWSYIDDFLWDEGDAAGTLLFSDSVNPNKSGNYTDNGVSIKCYSPSGFCSILFDKWRGSIKYRFKIMKTEFHSGRLAVSFYPFDSDYQALTTTNLPNTYYLEREIIDVRYGSEFTVTVPFMYHKPYLSTTINSSIGVLQIHVVDKMTRTNNVSPNVQIIVEAAGGPDIEFAQPVTSTVLPFLPSTLQMADLTQECSLVEKSIGSMSQGPVTSLFAEMCIGEKILSLRQLLKISSYHSFTANTLTAREGLNVNGFAWVPYDAHSTGNATVPIDTWGDYYTLFSSIFAAMSGSIRIKLMSTTATKNKWLAVLQNARSGPFYSPLAMTSSTIYPNSAKMGIAVPSDPLVSGGFEFTQAFYNFTNIKPTADTMWASYGVGVNVPSPGTSDTTVTVQFGEALTPAIARCGGDDINFYGFVSIPPLFNYTTPSTNASSFQ